MEVIVDLMLEFIDKDDFVCIVYGVEDSYYELMILVYMVVDIWLVDVSEWCVV